MTFNNGDNVKIVYLQDSTAASMASGSYSSASEDNLSFILRNAILVIEGPPPETEGYAAVTGADRERMKRVYPRPSMAKVPAIGKELDVT